MLPPQVDLRYRLYQVGLELHDKVVLRRDPRPAFEAWQVDRPSPSDRLKSLLWIRSFLETQLPYRLRPQLGHSFTTKFKIRNMGRMENERKRRCSQID